MRRPGSICCISFLVSLAAVAGCGEDPYVAGRPKVVPVSGVVTYGGKPVEGATVTFRPREEGMPSASGKTDADGRFLLTTFFDRADEGAVVGEHDVTIVKYQVFAPEGDGEDVLAAVPPPKALIPENYANPRTSGLTATIDSEENNEVTFDLSG